MSHQRRWPPRDRSMNIQPQRSPEQMRVWSSGRVWSSSNERSASSWLRYSSSEVLVLSCSRTCPASRRDEPARQPSSSAGPAVERARRGDRVAEHRRQHFVDRLAQLARVPQGESRMDAPCVLASRRPASACDVLHCGRSSKRRGKPRSRPEVCGSRADGRQQGLDRGPLCIRGSGRREDGSVDRALGDGSDGDARLGLGAHETG